MNILVTGITGFAGSHLAELLIRHGHGVRGLGGPQDPLTHLEGLIDAGELSRQDIVLADLEDRSALESLLDPAPDCVYHLAAQASVPRSWDNPRETFRINVMGTLALLDCLKELSPCPKVLHVGSADVYGKSVNAVTSADDGGGITEDCPLNPMNPYALSKASADQLCQQYFLRDGLPIVRVRAFNHIGPRQGPGFAASDFAKQIAVGEVDSNHRRLHVGNLEAVRDFTDVRDMMSAYQLAMTKGESGAVYNLCSGVGRTIQELLDGLLSLATSEFDIVPDPALFRPVEIPRFVGSNRHFVDTTGWSPRIPWEQTLSDILDYHRQAIQRHGNTKDKRIIRYHSEEKLRLTRETDDPTVNSM